MISVYLLRNPDDLCSNPTSLKPSEKKKKVFQKSGWERQTMWDGTKQQFDKNNKCENLHGDLWSFSKPVNQYSPPPPRLEK